MTENVMEWTGIHLYILSAYSTQLTRGQHADIASIHFGPTIRLYLLVDITVCSTSVKKLIVIKKINATKLFNAN